MCVEKDGGVSDALLTTLSVFSPMAFCGTCKGGGDLTLPNRITDPLNFEKAGHLHPIPRRQNIGAYAIPPPFTEFLKTLQEKDMHHDTSEVEQQKLKNIKNI